jgi:HupE / UreJ protein
MQALRWLMAWLIFSVAAPAAAHLTPNSTIELDFRDAEVSVQVTIPQSELSYAYGQPMLSEAEMRAHFAVKSADGRAWNLGPMRISGAKESGPPDLIARFTATPPPGQSLRTLRLHYSAVIDRVSSHNVLVLAKSDFAGGVIEGHPKLLGAVQGSKRTLTIDLGAPSRWAGFAASLRLGMHHIAEGFDHLLFLLSLLLPAPLIAKSGRWQGAAGRRKTVRRLALIITAFTIGHSLTLIGGAFFGWSLPSQPVEIGIALSILISAIHAARPLFAGREALVASGFGLIHGLAFATVIGSFSLQPVDKAVAILGFNLGIEAVQLIVAAAVLPFLLWLAGRPAYQHFRQVGALFAGAAALFWLWERV